MTERSAYPRDMADLTITGRISKVDEDKRQVFGWASVTEIDGEPVVDLQNDTLDTYELEKAAYDYVLHSRVGGAMHARQVTKDSSPKQVGTLIESFVITPEKVEKMGLPPETPRGWWIGFQIGDDDDVWKKVKKGEFTGFSIHGVGKRTPVEKSVMARTRQEYDGWLKRMAHITGEDADDLDLSLKSWMSQEGVNNPSDDDVHNFLMEAYSDGDSDGEVTKGIAKHLIGRHEQKDHDPTKSSGRETERGGFRIKAGDSKKQAPHSRKEHKGLRRKGPTFLNRASQWRKSGPSDLALLSEKTGLSEDEVLGQLYGAGATDYHDALAVAEKKGLLKKDDREKQGIVPVSRENRRQLAEEADELLGKRLSKSDQRKLFLLAKIAERSKSEDEAASYAETVSKALDEAGQEELSTYFSAVHKHLIGRHEQDDHDPTKKGKKRHKRSQHGGMYGKEGVSQGAKVGAGLGVAGGVLGSILARRVGLPPSTAARMIGGGVGGAATGYQVGGGQLFGNQPGAGPLARFGAGTANTLANLPGTLLRRTIHGDPNAYLRQQRTNRRKKKMSKAFSEREQEVLSKYLGKDFL